MGASITYRERARRLLKYDELQLQALFLCNLRIVCLFLYMFYKRITHAKTLSAVLKGSNTPGNMHASTLCIMRTMPLR